MSIANAVTNYNSPWVWIGFPCAALALLSVAVHSNGNRQEGKRTVRTGFQGFFCRDEEPFCASPLQFWRSDAGEASGLH